MIDRLHERGLIYADYNQNAVFIRRSLDESKIIGASKRGTVGFDNQFKGLAEGSKRSEGWFYFTKGEQKSDPVKRVVLVESPIDAMSLAVLERTDSLKTLYLSTDGTGQIPTEYLKEVGSVVIAFDRDRAGREMTERIKSQLPGASTKIPSSNDWNQDLVNSFDWTSQKRSKSYEILHPSRGIERDGGLSL